MLNISVTLFWAILWLSFLVMKPYAVPNIVHPIITPSPDVVRREEGGGLIGYESLGPNSWGTSVCCKSWKKVWTWSNSMFGCFENLSTETRLESSAGPCKCSDTTSCWRITLFTDINDEKPRTGTGCSTPAYNGNLYVNPIPRQEEGPTSMPSQEMSTSVTSTASSTAPSATISQQPGETSTKSDNKITPGELAGIVIGTITAITGIIVAVPVVRSRMKNAS